MKLFRKIAILTTLILLLGILGGVTVTAETTERTGQRYDFDGSNGRTVADAMLLLRHVDGWDDGVIAELEGDVSGDGKISVYDAVCFLKLLLNDTFDMEKSLKVITYNIKAGYYNQGQTLSYIAEMLREADADIVGLQEVDYLSNRSSASGDQLAYLAQAAGYTYYKFAPVLELGNKTVAASTEATSNLYGHGILSKYPIESYQLIYPEAQGVTSDGTAAEIRAIARYELNVDGKTVAVYNSHLNRSVSNLQFAEIQNNYMLDDRYAIFMGDMNAEPELLTDLNTDRFELLTDYDPHDTTPIDHIIVSNDTIAWHAETVGEVENVTAFTVLSKEVPEFTWSGAQYTKASDHNLRYAYIMLKDY